jgi:hypothetical protein
MKFVSKVRFRVALDNPWGPNGQLMRPQIDTKKCSSLNLCLNAPHEKTQLAFATVQVK